MTFFGCRIHSRQRFAHPRNLMAGFIALAAMLAGSTAFAQVSAVLVAQEGDTPAGAPAPVDTISPPFINGSGDVGFTGGLTDGDRYVWFGTQILWLNSNETTVSLGGAEAAMGISDSNGFIYSPSVDGDDAVYTHNGVLLVENLQAPGFPDGVVNTFNSRPSMLPGGRAFWVSGINESGGTSTEKRVLYTSADGTPATIEVVLAGGDVVDGLVIEDTGIRFDYRHSDDGTHHIHELDMATGSTSNDIVIVVDGAIVAQESSLVPGGVGEAWQTFDAMSINNSGEYVFSGDTNADSSKDEFVAYNSTLAAREGDTVDGIALLSGSSVRTVQINNKGQVMMIWNVDSVETLFVSCDAQDIVGTASALLSTGDQVDLDGDGVADATVTDFNASPTLARDSLADDGRVYIEVELDYGDGVEIEAMLQLDGTCCGNGAIDRGEDCDESGAETATCDLDCTIAECGDGTTNMTADEECDDAGESATCDLDCTVAECGDGTTNMTAGEQCDDAGESATCDLDCTIAECGDGTVNGSAQEQCDDNGESATCDLDCTIAECGDGTTNMTADEQCDDAGESATCDLDCTVAECGDGTINAAALETCDDMGESATCDLDCTAAECGDGTVNATAYEECDDAGESAACDVDCTPAECGDGRANASAGEECDDAGESAACDTDCTRPLCGDGILNVLASELCDDGNTTNGDGCSSRCLIESDDPGDPGDGDGCSCQTSGTGNGTAPWGVGLLAGLAWLTLRRRRRDTSAK